MTASLVAWEATANVFAAALHRQKLGRADPNANPAPQAHTPHRDA